MQQIEGTRPPPDQIRTLASSMAVLETMQQVQRQRGAARTDTPVRPVVDKPRQLLAQLYVDQVAARYRVAVATQESFRERLIYFWSNHFAVSVDKGTVLALAATLENEAIRPHLTGYFSDLLLAVEAHPAMVLYLDNRASVGPNSSLARRIAYKLRDGKKLGINENLAREILELHTLGVNSGYTQADVTAFAEVLTGWSLGGKRELFARDELEAFKFRQQAHEPGAKWVLGKRYPDSGVEQARTVLKDLARHPATAIHIATKLARHFVADEPPQHAVARLAKAFRDSDGHLPTLHGALIGLSECWQAKPVKFKTPQDFIISSFRCSDFIPDLPPQIIAPFQQLGQRPYAPGSPAGWPDTAAQWDGPDALLKRIEWATQFGARIKRHAMPLQLLEDSLDESASERTRTAVARAASAAQGITLLFSSPQFMRR